MSRSSNKTCIIIHGCPSRKKSALDSEGRTYDKHWIPWVKRALNRCGIKTVTPLMPRPWAPEYETFKQEFEKNTVTAKTVLVGHSCGCAFLVRWLGETKQKIGTLILVAPAKIARRRDRVREGFYGFDIDKMITARVGKIIMFTSDNEKERLRKSLKVYQRALGGEVIGLKGRGHYTFKDMGTEEFPELLEKIILFDSRKALLLPLNSRYNIFIQDRRGHKKPDWGYFGGEIEARETPSHAIVREAKEELDIDVSPGEVRYLGVSITDWNDRKIIRYLFLYPTDQSGFNVREGKGGHWLTFDEARGRLDNKDGFDEIVERINEYCGII